VDATQRGGGWYISAAATKQWVTSTGANCYEYGVQALVHCWSKCVTNGGGCEEKIVLCS